MEILRNLVLLLAILLIVGFWGCTKKVQPIQTDTIHSKPIVGMQNTNEDSFFGEEGEMDEEGAMQEPAWTYFERLSLAFDGDSTFIGMKDDMNFPDWYSGCFFNNNDKLTINVIGDTVELRKMLIKLLDGYEFDLGVGVCNKKTQLQTKQLLEKALEKSSDKSELSISREQGDTLDVSATLSSQPDGTIEVTLYGDTVNAVDRFKKEIFDSPILRFKTGVSASIILL